MLRMFVQATLAVLFAAGLWSAEVTLSDSRSGIVQQRISKPQIYSGRVVPKVDGDLALWSMDMPDSVYMEPNVAFTPTVTVINTGSSLPLTGYQLIFQIRGEAKALVYADTISVVSPDSIQPGAKIQYVFKNFTPLEVSFYMVTAFVTIAGDPNVSDDTLRAAFVTFNTLEGNVTDDNNGGVPLAGVTINATGTAVYSTISDGSGSYSFLAMNAGYYTITAILPGYNIEIIDSVQVTDGLETTRDINMGFPVLSYGPKDSMYVSLGWGMADSTTWDLNLSNTGTRDLHYSLRWPVDTVSGTPESLIIDDGSRDNEIGIGGTKAFLFLNRFSPNSFPFELSEVQVYFGTEGMVIAGDSLNIVIYENTSGNDSAAVGSNPLYNYLTTIQAIGDWNSFVLPEAVQLNGPGDVLIAVIALKTSGTGYWPASMDETSPQTRSWAGWWTTANPSSTMPTLPTDDTFVRIDDYFSGNWMIRGVGEVPAENATWLTLDESAGTIGASNEHNLGLTFNTANCDSFTNLGANVMIKSDGAVKTKYNYLIPAYMHVQGTGVSGKPNTPLGNAFALNNNRPNPANGETTFSFNLPQTQDYSLKIYNIAGQVVQSFSGKGTAGINRLAWNTGKNSTGIYFYQLRSGSQSATRKLVVVK